MSDDGWKMPAALVGRCRTAAEILREGSVEHRKRAAFRRGETTIGPWRYDPSLLVIRHEQRSYEIDVERCRGSAGVLDWIVQVSKKTWCSREALGQLVEALDAVLSLQANYCSLGVDSPKKARSKLRGLRRTP